MDEVDGVEEDSPYPAPPSHASVSQVSSYVKSM